MLLLRTISDGWDTSSCVGWIGCDHVYRVPTSCKRRMGELLQVFSLRLFRDVFVNVYLCLQQNRNTYQQHIHTTICRSVVHHLNTACIEICILRLHNLGLLLQHPSSRTNHNPIGIRCILSPPGSRWIYDVGHRRSVSRKGYSIS